MNIEDYLLQFDIFGKDENFNNDHISFVLYKTILNKFRTFFTQQEHEILICFQIKILSLIENLRKLDVEYINDVMNYIQSININKNSYETKYEKNTKKYNHKMIRLVNEKYLENFCIEALSRNNHIPVHCFDYIWNYIDSVVFSLEFINYNCGDYIKISVIEEKIIDTNFELHIILGINMVYLMKNGLGNCKYNHQIDNVSFNEIIYNMLYTQDTSEKILKSKTGENFKTQMTQIKKNPDIYFNNNILELINNIHK